MDGITLSCHRRQGSRRRAHAEPEVRYAPTPATTPDDDAPRGAPAAVGDRRRGDSLPSDRHRRRRDQGQRHGRLRQRRSADLALQLQRLRARLHDPQPEPRSLRVRPGSPAPHGLDGIGHAEPHPGRQRQRRKRLRGVRLCGGRRPRARRRARDRRAAGGGEPVRVATAVPLRRDRVRQRSAGRRRALRGVPGEGAARDHFRRSVPGPQRRQGVHRLDRQSWERRRLSRAGLRAGAGHGGASGHRPGRLAWNRTVATARGTRDRAPSGPGAGGRWLAAEERRWAPAAAQADPGAGFERRGPGTPRRGRVCYPRRERSST